MMDFGYSDQQNSLKELASKILEKNTKKNLINTNMLRLGHIKEIFSKKFQI